MKKTNYLLQAAVVSALGAAASASTFTSSASGSFAKEYLNSGSTTTPQITLAGTNNGSFSAAVKHTNAILFTGAESYINRVQPLNIKITLNGGKFAAGISAPAAKSAYLQGQVVSAGGTFRIAGSAGLTAAASPGAVTIVGGGSAGDTFITYSLDPSKTTGGKLVKGVLSIGNLQIGSLATSLGAGQPLTATVQMIDPTTAGILETLTPQLATSKSAFSVKAAPSTGAQQFIEVSTGGKQFTGSSNNFTAGTVTVTADNTTVKPTGSNAADLTDVSNMNFKVAGLSSFAAFSSSAPVGGTVYIQVPTTAAGTGTSCNVVPTATTLAAPNYGPAAGGNTTSVSIVTPSFNQSGAATGAVTAAAVGSVCFLEDTVTAITEGTPTIQLVGADVATVTGPKGTVAAAVATSVVSMAATPLSTMAKNGFSTKFPSVFASADTLFGVTFVRLVNNSSVAGNVWFTIKDESGAQVATTATPFAMAALQSKLWSISDLETLFGSALPKTGKPYRLEISSTLPTGTQVVAQAFIYTPNGTISNITPEKTN